MKITLYFEYTRRRPDRARIKEERIEYVMKHAEKVETQSDGRI